MHRPYVTGPAVVHGRLLMASRATAASVMVASDLATVLPVGSWL